uniref:Lipopolysaccharide biosynthesis protein n=1 Tax=uncultured Acetothermia bacterium TaxID=236499 RepID=H5SH41_9BACT|nr:lipopolysaccharide biosynthesis protein [uncultured Acetothermia bacterium]
MDEYEIDLRDYLKVIWEKKWLILGVFVVAVVLAALVSFRMPNEYEARALLRLRSLPNIDGLNLKPPSLQQIAAIVQSDELLLQAAHELQPRYPEFQGATPLEVEQWLKRNLKASVMEKADLVEVRLPGNLAPDRLRETLSLIVTLTETKLQSDLQANINLELTRLSTTEKAVQEQLDAVNAQLQSEIAKRKEILTSQRAELLARMDEIRQNPQFLRLAAGEQNATLQGIMLKREFEALTERLKNIETDLQKLDARGRELFPELHSRLQSLENERTQLQLLEGKVQQVFAKTPETLDIVSAPFAPEEPVGPRRTLNVLIAGVLGLFGGTLLAFFVNYLREPQKETSDK